MVSRSAFVVAAVLAVAGCAAVPDGGPAVPVAASGLAGTVEPESTSVNAELPGPSSDAQDSLAAYGNALRITRDPGRLGDLFVTKQGRASFAQDPTVVVVRALDLDVTANPDPATATAVLSGSLIGGVNADGVFEEAGGRNWKVQVRMARVGGVWLFADAPPLVVDEAEFTDAFTAVDVYFAAAPSTVAGSSPKLVIPEQRYVNRDVGGPATQIVDFVLSGPSDTLSRVATNPIPNVKRNSSVALDNGDLVIELRPEAESFKPEALNQFVAEVGWSLDSVFSGRVRLLVGGRAIDVKGFKSVQEKSDWQRYNRAAVAGPLPYYLVQRGRVVKAPGTPESAPGGPRLDAPVLQRDVRSAAVSLDLRRFSVVRSDPAGGQRLWIADSSGTLQPTLRATSVGRPSWGGNRSTVLVPINGQLIQVGVGNAGAPVAVQVVGADGRPINAITTVRLSLDGMRALVMAGTGADARVYVGTLNSSAEAGGALVLTVRRLNVGGEPQDVAWAGPVTAAVATTEGGNAVSLVLAPVDGSPVATQSTGLSVGSGPIRLAADPTVDGQADVPLEVGGRVYSVSQSGQATSVVAAAGGSPLYPG